MREHSTFLAAFESQCELRGDAIALVHNDQSWTYSDLNNASNNIAATLIEKGAAKNNIVALVSQRSLQTIAAMIATMKTGAAFMPVDTTAPDDRVRYILNDASATHVCQKSRNRIQQLSR